MTTRIALDSIRLDDNCITDRPEIPPSNHRDRRSRRHAEDPTPAVAQCTGSFRFHFFEEGSTVPERVDIAIPFERTGLDLRIPRAVNDIQVSQIARHGLSTVITQDRYLQIFSSAAFLRRNVNESLGALNLPNTPSNPVGDILYEVMSVGEFENPDSIQFEQFNRLLTGIYGTSPERRNNLVGVVPASLAANPTILNGDPALLVRLNALVDIFEIYRYIKTRLPDNLPPAVQAQVKQVFENLVTHLYFNRPSLQDVGERIRATALSLYRLAPTAGGQRINFYTLLRNLLTANDTCVVYNIRTGQPTTTVRVPLNDRAPFNRAGDPRAARLVTLQRLMTNFEPRLTDTFVTYLSEPNHHQATFNSIFSALSTPDALRGIVSRVTSDTRIIRPNHLTTAWLSENHHHNLIEVLKACVFDPAHPDQGPLRFAPTSQGTTMTLNVEVLRRRIEDFYRAHSQPGQAGPQALPNAQLGLNVGNLATRVTGLLDRNLTDRREFQATVLSVCATLFGTRGDNIFLGGNEARTSLQVFAHDDIGPIRLEINNTEALRGFFTETVAALGGREVLTETVAPWMQGVMCAGGAAATIVGATTADHDNEVFAPLYAAGTFGVVSGCGPLIHRAFRGSPQNVWSQWGWYGLAGAGAGLAAGFLAPPIRRAAQGDQPVTPPDVTPPIPIEQQSGTTVVTDYHE